MSTSVAPESTSTSAPAAPVPAAAAAPPETALTAASAPAAAAPATYDLKLSADIPAEVKGLLDPALVERTAAKARELGLSNDAGQQMLDAHVSEMTAYAKSVAKAQADTQKASQTANQPGGAEWTARETAWSTAAKSDKEIGGEQFPQHVEMAQQALRRFGTPELRTMLAESGLGSHPEAIRVFARIGKAMSEPGIIRGAVSPQQPKSDSELFYTHPSSKPKPAA